MDGEGEMWIEREKCGLRGRKVDGEGERWMER